MYLCKRICVNVFVWIFSLVSNPELIAILPEGQRFEIFFPDDWWIFCFALILNFHLWASSHPKILLDVLTQIRYLANISNIGNHGNFPHHLWPQGKKFCFGKPDIINWISCGLASSWLPWLSSLSLKLESTTINYVSTLTLQSMRNTQSTKKQKISKTLDSLPLAHIYRQCTIDFTKRLKIFYVILLI